MVLTVWDEDLFDIGIEITTLKNLAIHRLPLIQSDTKKRELLKNPTKLKKAKKKKIIDRN